MNKEGTLYKVGLLGVLCAICGVALSGINSITAPLIAQARLEKELANLELIYPDATFEELSVTDESGYVKGAYRAEGFGTVYKVGTTGYSSNGFTFLVAYNEDDTIGGFQVLEQSETSGFGSRCFEPDFIDKLIGLDVAEETPLLSGATVTSSAIRRGVAAAASLYTGGSVAMPAASSEEKEETPAAAPAIAISSEELAEYEAACELTSEEGTSAVYACHAKGFGLVVGMEGKYSENEANITVDTAEKSIVTVEVTKYGDTPNIGDTATSEEALAGYAGKTLGDEIDAVSGATFTTKSVVAMAQAALNAAAGE